MAQKLPIFKRDLVYTLQSSIEDNLHLYLGEGFDSYFQEKDLKAQIKYIDETDIRLDDFVNLEVAGGGEKDAKNAYIIFKAISGMTPYLAADERVWVALTHTFGFQFARDRWLEKAKNDKDKAIKAIRSHFFCVGGHRGFHRDNAFSALWWWAYLMHRIGGAQGFESRLLTLLRETDVRQAIIDRPGTSRPVNVLSALIRVVEKEYPTNKNWFKRAKNKNNNSQSAYLKWMKRINALGGATVYEAMSVDELTELFTRLLIESAEG